MSAKQVSSSYQSPVISSVMMISENVTFQFYLWPLQGADTFAYVKWIVSEIFTIYTVLHFPFVRQELIVIRLMLAMDDSKHPPAKSLFKLDI